MNPGIFYLYEYNNTQKLRNVGYLKLTRHYHSCILQLNARGIPVTYADTLKLCAFYLENDTVGATVLAEIPCTNHMVTARLKFAECQFPDGHTLNTMDGFFLPLSRERILAAAVPGILVDTKKLLAVFENPPADKNSSSHSEHVPKAQDVFSDHDESLPINHADSCVKEEVSESQKHSADAEENPADTQDQTADTNEESFNTQDQPAIQDTNPETSDNPPMTSDGCTAILSEEPRLPDIIDDAHDQKDIVPDTCSAKNNEATAAPDTDSAASDSESDNNGPDGSDNIPPDNDTCAPDSSGTAPSSEDSPPDNSDTEAAENTPPHNIRKIQRSDMSVLPRHYWHLANNSFLLHGYHNYSHLLLVEKDGHYWLGVPGIYDSREARAARLFGFPQFTDSYNEHMDLSDEEKNNQGTFGYWCCFLK